LSAHASVNGLLPAVAAHMGILLAVVVTDHVPCDDRSPRGGPWISTPIQSSRF
jgi:hypothetical protein